MTVWGISRLKVKKPAHCPNGFLVKGVFQKEPITEMKIRFFPDVSFEIKAPCSLKIYPETQITFCESYYTQCLKILGFTLFSPLNADAIETLKLIQNRAQTELNAKVLMITNSLLHKFDPRYYSPN